MTESQAFFRAAIETAIRKHWKPIDGLDPVLMADDIAGHLERSGWLIAHLDDPMPESPTLLDMVTQLPRKSP